MYKFMILKVDAIDGSIDDLVMGNNARARPVEILDNSSTRKCLTLYIDTVEQDTGLQGITFKKARRVTNRSLKMTIWSLGTSRERFV